MLQCGSPLLAGTAAPIVRLRVRYEGIVLQNSKMKVREDLAIFQSQWIFGNTMPCNELTNEAGWKSDCSALKKFARAPKKSFATQSIR
jgi:hypothetical protein